ncbi:MAG: helix-turn-helix domain-containing protein [Eisenbergiella sp.]
MVDWLGIPDKKLYRDFKMFWCQLSSYLEIRRIRCAQEYLKEGRAVQDVAAAVGYSSDYSFRRAFKRVVGVAPSDYQKRF